MQDDNVRSGWPHQVRLAGFLCSGSYYTDLHEWSDSTRVQADSRRYVGQWPSFDCVAAQAAAFAASLWSTPSAAPMARYDSRNSLRWFARRPSC